MQFQKAVDSLYIKENTDITLLKAIAKYLSSVIGSPVSVKKVTDFKGK